MTNGVEPHNKPPDKNPPLFRQGETMVIPRRNGSPRLLRTLICEPVDQGIISSSTRVIISSDPFVEDQEEIDGSGSDDAVSVSSHSRSHLSLADFDPDAFLATSLTLHLQTDHVVNGSSEPNGTNGANSFDSSTSGSITPRPGYLTPESTPATVEELGEEGGFDEGRYAKFRAIPAIGPGPSNVKGEEMEVVWMGLGGLGRAGIFEHDWVLLKPVEDVSVAAVGRLVRVQVWERLDEDPDLWVRSSLS